MELENVKRHLEDVKRLIDKEDALALVHKSKKLKDIDDQEKPFPKLKKIDYTQGKDDADQLKLMFGGTATEVDVLTSLLGNRTLPTMNGSDVIGTAIRQGKKMVMKQTFKTSISNSITQLCLVSCGKAWLRYQGCNEITLSDGNGKIDETLTFDTGVADMIAVGDNTLLICGLQDRDIKHVTFPEGKTTSLFSTENLTPRGICNAFTGDLYVTVRDKSDFHVYADSMRAIVRYSPLGREKNIVQYDKRGDVLFVLPRRVRVSNTGDVIGVTNATDDDNNHLVLLNTDLTLWLRYLGNGKVVSIEDKFDTCTYKPDKKYYTTDFTFDSLDNIIICEAYSKCVKLLSRDCIPTHTIFTKRESVPTTIALADDEIWLGFEDGNVKIYKIK